MINSARGAPLTYGQMGVVDVVVVVPTPLYGAGLIAVDLSVCLFVCLSVRDTDFLAHRWMNFDQTSYTDSLDHVDKTHFFIFG